MICMLLWMLMPFILVLLHKCAISMALLHVYGAFAPYLCCPYILMQFKSILLPEHATCSYMLPIMVSLSWLSWFSHWLLWLFCLSKYHYDRDDWDGSFDGFTRFLHSSTFACLVWIDLVGLVDQLVHVFSNPSKGVPIHQKGSTCKHLSLRASPFAFVP